MRWLSAPTSVVLVLAAAACQKEAREKNPEPKDERPRVFTLAYPSTFLAETVGGDDVRVVDVRPEHDDPAVWSPSQEIIFTIQEEAPVVLIGGGFEPWYREKDFAPFSVHRLVEPLGAAAVERPGGGPLPHFWLEPEALDLAAGGLADHLSARLPSASAGFRARKAALSKRLGQLDADLRRILSDLPPLFSSRIGYEYAARAYGWDLQVLAVDPQRTPTPEEVERWRTRREGHGARLVLFPRASPDEVAAGLRAAGLEPLVFSLMTHRDAEALEAGADYFDLYRENAKRLAAAAAGPSKSP